MAIDYQAFADNNAALVTALQQCLQDHIDQAKTQAPNILPPKIKAPNGQEYDWTDYRAKMTADIIALQREANEYQKLANKNKRNQPRIFSLDLEL